MQGSIQKRTGKRGVSWTVVYDDPTAAHRRQRRKTFKTKREATAFLTQTLHQIQTGGFIEPRAITTGEYLDYWLETYALHNVRPTTYRSYEQVIRLHAKPALGTVLLQKLQPAHLQLLYSDKLTNGRADGNGGLAPRTVQYLHRILREALNQALKWQMVNRNVADATEPPRAARAQVTVWNDEQVRTFLGATEHDYYAPVWHVALTTGLRRGELLGLRWQDVDFEDGVLRVRQSLVEVNGTPLFQEPKTKSGRRTVALFPVTLSELRAHRTRQLQHRLAIGPAWEDHDLVFANADGRPVYPANLARHFRRRMKELQLPTIPFHSLRHTHATLMLRDGMHVKVMSERLGHSSIAITLDTYQHVLPDMQRQALELMNTSIFATG